MGWTLAIDVGTSRTAGALADATGVTPLELEGNRWMPSLVAVDDDGELVVGQAAAAISAATPERAERAPKRSVGSPVPMVLGGRAVHPGEAFGALMAAVAAEGKRRRDGEDPEALVLTHPVRWEEARQVVLTEAAASVGLPDPVLVPEPVAAAFHYAAGELADGATVGVYDLGGGTFDTVVMRRTADSFEVLGPPGGDESIGGDHFDHQVFLHLGGLLAAHDAEVWQQLQTSTERRWVRAAHDLLIEARRIKETLSMYPSTRVYVPVADTELLVTREEFEGLIARPIERSVDELLDTLDDAGVEPEALEAVYLVGGSSRIPLVATRLEEEFGVRVRTRDEPKSVVVEGAAALGLRPLGPASDGGPSPAATTSWPAVGFAPPAEPATGDGQLVLAAADGLRVISETGVVELAASGARSPAMARGRVVALEGERTVSSWSPSRSPERQWTSSLPAPAVAAPVLAGDATVVALASGEVVALDHRGQATWTLPSGHGLTGIAASASVAVASTAEGRLLCLDVMTGRVRWIYPTRDRIDRPVELGGRLLYSASRDGILYALEVETGRPAWAYRLEQPDGPHPVLVGDLVVFATGAELVALDRGQGAERWRLPTSSRAERLRGGPATATAVLADGSVGLIRPAGRWEPIPGVTDLLAVGPALAMVRSDRVEFAELPPPEHD